MQFPRHNIPQYMGNAVWDAYGAMSLPTALRAMLGDPFAYARSASLELLVRLLKGEERNKLSRSFGASWPLSDRYIGYAWAVDTRARLLRALGSRFDRRYLLQSDLWKTHLPEAIRRVLSTTPPSDLPEEVALCAAVALADLDFQSRSAADIWFYEMMPDEGVTDAHAAYYGELMDSFWTALFRGQGADTEDPHGVIYTSAYQMTASGWYGGNMSVVFAAADAPWGSGMDRRWTEFGCPGPAPKYRDKAEWKRSFCDRHNYGDVDETSRNNADGGEIRTPNYKTASELDGVLLYSWHAPHDVAWSQFEEQGWDFAKLANPVKWAFFRVPVAPTADAVPMTIVLAPYALQAPVYGIDRHCDAINPATPCSFVAAASELGDDVRVQGMPTGVADLPNPSALKRPPVWARRIPVWGMLYPCARSNLHEASKDETVQAVSERDRRHGCVAARALSSHMASLDASTRAAGSRARLPAGLLAELSALRVWSFESTVDVGAANLSVRSPRPRESVCAVRMAEVEARRREFCG